MKNYKTILCIILALAIPLMLLAGCGNGEDETEADPDATLSDDPIVNDPGIDPGFIFGEGIDENGFWEGIRALDYVEMINYRGIQIPSDIHQEQGSDSDIQDIINEILADFTTYEPIPDREIVDGDTVNIDYVGSVDGEEFFGGSTEGEGTFVTIGVTEYIDDFLEQLIGHSPGETINVEVTFPDEYPNNPELERKDAVFVTTINFIGGEPIIPELSDAFVAENLSQFYGWETVAEMEEYFRAYLEGGREDAIRQFLYEYLTDNIIIRSIPEQIISYKEREMISSYQAGAISEGVEIEEVLGWYGLSTLDELKDFHREEIENDASFSLIIQAIAEDAEIIISDDEVAEFFSENYGDFPSFVEEYGMPMLKQFVLSQRVFEFIYENVILM